MAIAVRLSCEECRRRKTKCDKQLPCSACRQARLKCTSTERQRLPRGRHVVAGDSRSKTSAKQAAPVLESRVAHLEGLVKQLKAHVESGDGSHTDTSSDAAPVPIKARSLLAKDFFATLSREVAGIRDTLQPPDEYRPCGTAGCGGSEPMSTVEDRWPPPVASSTVMFGAPPATLDGSDLDIPPYDHRLKLVEIFQDRVDRIYKATHFPAVSKMLKRRDANNWQAPRPYATSIMTLERAIYFISVCTMTENECAIMLYEEKAVLLARYRASVEAALSRSSLLTNADKLTIQAFLLYLMGIRTMKDYALAWTLVSVAVRALSALGLPYSEVDPTSVAQFMHLRLQYAIAALDSQTCMDRAVAPLMGMEYFRHQPPIVNDADIELSQITESRQGLSDMSFPSKIYEVTLCYRRLNCMPMDEPGSYVHWQAKQQVVADFTATMRESLVHLEDTGNNFVRYLKTCTESAILHMELLLRRPMFRCKDNPAPPDDDFDVLSVATQCMEAVLWRANDGAFAPWAWFSKAWPRWHVLAILLAELCVPRSSDLASRAYAVAKQGFTYCEEIMDCPDLVTVWEPIKKLMAQVHRVRSYAAIPDEDPPLLTPAQSSASPDSLPTIGDVPMAEPMAPLHDMPLTASSMFDPTIDLQNDAMWMNWNSFLQGFDDSWVNSQTSDGLFLGGRVA